MADFIGNGLEQGDKNIFTGELGIIGPNGILVTPQLSSVGVFTGSTLIVQGGIIARGNAVLLLPGGGTIVISSTGSRLAQEFGNHKLDFESGFVGGPNCLSNAGEIVAFNDAVFYDTYAGEICTAAVINTGTMISQTASVLRGDGLQSVSLTNHGLMDGATYGVLMTGDTIVQILNTGTVNGALAAIYVAGILPATIINRGWTDGAVLLGNGPDRYQGRTGFNRMSLAKAAMTSSSGAPQTNSCLAAMEMTI